MLGGQLDATAFRSGPRGIQGNVSTLFISRINQCLTVVDSAVSPLLLSKEPLLFSVLRSMDLLLSGFTEGGRGDSGIPGLPPQRYADWWYVHYSHIPHPMPHGPLPVLTCFRRHAQLGNNWFEHC